MGSFHMNTFASTCMTGLSERSIRIPPGVGGEDNACIYYWDGWDGPGGDDGCPACANFAMKVRPGHCYLLPGKEGRWAILHGDKVSALLTSFPACLIDCLLACWLAGWLVGWLQGCRIHGAYCGSKSQPRTNLIYRAPHAKLARKSARANPDSTRGMTRNGPITRSPSTSKSRS